MVSSWTRLSFTVQFQWRLCSVAPEQRWWSEFEMCIVVWTAPSSLQSWEGSLLVESQCRVHGQKHNTNSALSLQSQCNWYTSSICNRNFNVCTWILWCCCSNIDNKLGLNKRETFIMQMKRFLSKVCIKCVGLSPVEPQGLHQKSDSLSCICHH